MSPRKSSALVAVSNSMAITIRAWATDCSSFSAEVMPMLTKSSWLPLVGMDPVEAGLANTRISATSAAAVTWAIISPDSRPAADARNGAVPH